MIIDRDGHDQMMNQLLRGFWAPREMTIHKNAWLLEMCCWMVLDEGVILSFCKCDHL